MIFLFTCTAIWLTWASGLTCPASPLRQQNTTLSHGAGVNGSSKNQHRKETPMTLRTMP